jgi:uncharacterized damage-inducible protein DinB
VASRGYDLADTFDRATDRLVGLVRSMSDEQWNMRAPEASWTVAQEALHLGVWMEIEGDWFARLASGKLALPLSKEAADRINDHIIADNPAPDREQVLLEIAGNRTLIRHFLIGLSDDALEREIPTSMAFITGSDDVSISIGDLAARMLAGHVEHHLSVIEATIDGPK